MRRDLLTFTLALIVGICLGAVSDRDLSAQQSAPTKAKGRAIKTLATHDVGPQIPELQGYYLEMRSVTFEPGGHGVLHSHKDRPVLLYVLQGTLTECNAEGKCTDVHEGEAIAEGKERVGWPENRGTQPVTFLAIEISKKKP
jgi:quercetin dioxygenase-like cupin family protein